MNICFLEICNENEQKISSSEEAVVKGNFCKKCSFSLKYLTILVVGMCSEMNTKNILRRTCNIPLDIPADRLTGETIITFYTGCSFDHHIFFENN